MIEHVYFPESGIISVVADGENAIEIGIIGRDGMSGVFSWFWAAARSRRTIPMSRSQETANPSWQATCWKRLKRAQRCTRNCFKYVNSFLI